ILDAATLTALFSGLAGLLTALFTALHSASKVQVAALSDLVASLREENGRLRARLTELEGDLEAARRNHATNEAKLAQLELALSATTTRLHEVESRLARAKAQLARLRQFIRSKGLDLPNE
ncbi:MAG: hypothetical protein ACRDIB_11800, partial [Ardenticatenaceae bacterium]